MHGLLRNLGLASLLLITFGAVTSEAVVIDFEVLEHMDGSLVDHGHSYIEDGFEISSPNSEQFGLTTFGTLESRFTGSTALFNNTIGGVTTLTRVGGGTFDLFSIDLAELNGPSVADVIFTTNLGDSQTFTLDGNAFAPETFLFNSDFLGVTSVSWSQDSPFHQFDNIVIDARVPEPTSVALLATGLLGVYLRRRRLG